LWRGVSLFTALRIGHGGREDGGGPGVWYPKNLSANEKRRIISNGEEFAREQSCSPQEGRLKRSRSDLVEKGELKGNFE